MHKDQSQSSNHHFPQRSIFIRCTTLHEYHRMVIIFHLEHFPIFSNSYSGFCLLRFPRTVVLFNFKEMGQFWAVLIRKWGHLDKDSHVQERTGAPLKRGWPAQLNICLLLFYHLLSLSKQQDLGGKKVQERNLRGEKKALPLYPGIQHSPLQILDRLKRITEK